MENRQLKMKETVLITDLVAFNCGRNYFCASSGIGLETGG